MYVIAYMSQLMQEMNMVGWTIERSRKPKASKGTWAEISHTELQHGFLKLSNDFFQQPSERQQRILIHELCHLPLFRLTEPMDQMVAGLPKMIRKTWTGALSALEEHVTESFAQMWIPRLPTPGNLCDEAGCLDPGCSHVQYDDAEE